MYDSKQAQWERDIHSFTSLKELAEKYPSASQWVFDRLAAIQQRWPQFISIDELPVKNEESSNV